MAAHAPAAPTVEPTRAPTFNDVRDASSRALGDLGVFTERRLEAVFESSNAAASHAHLIGVEAAAHGLRMWSIGIQAGQRLIAAKSVQERSELSWTTMNDMFAACFTNATALSESCAKAMLDVSRPFHR